MKKILFTLALLVGANALTSAQNRTKPAAPKTPFYWESANVYFLLTDRFNNGDRTNDKQYNRTKPTGKLRGFEGGDLRGVIQKIDEGYFDKLGITPFG